MVLQPNDKKKLIQFCEKIGLYNATNKPGGSKDKKINQIFSYLENMHVQLRHYSKRRHLTMVECGAGSCYLSMLVYYFYTVLQGRSVEIHCLDINGRLMEKANLKARRLGLDNMHFHAGDIGAYIPDGEVDVVYSLHACDTATDKSIALGVAWNARCIFSVTCCQNSIADDFRSGALTGLTKNSVFKERMVYMVGDSLRGIVLEQNGYQVEIQEFISSQFTGKNVMIRARRGQVRNAAELDIQYRALVVAFGMVPALESYISRFLECRIQSRDERSIAQSA